MKTTKLTDKLKLKFYLYNTIYLNTSYLFKIIFFVSECNFEVTAYNRRIKIIRKFKL